jgi:nitroreductase
MNPLPTSAILETLRWRYATKQFDASKKIPADVWHALEDALVLTPSSYGMQPWKFFVVTDDAVRARLREHSWNQAQVTDCSHHVVFAIPTKVDEASVERLIDRTAEVRGADKATLAFYRDLILKDIVHGPRSADAAGWASRQAYIALGNFMTCAALLGVDTCPMEGLDPARYDEILDLPAQGWHTIVACSAGYRAAGDKYATLPKVRFPKSDVITHI